MNISKLIIINYDFPIALILHSSIFINNDSQDIQIQ